MPDNERRQVRTASDRGGQMSDSVLSAARQRIPIKEVLPFFREAGIPRDIRSLQRYCESGLLDGIKEITATGETWFIAVDSIEPAITQLKQMHSAKGARQATTMLDTALVVSPPVAAEKPHQDKDATDGESPTPSDSDRPRQAENTGEGSATNSDAEPDMSGVVAQLEKRIADKDAEITFYREELKERRRQIADMKGIIDGQNALLEAINRSTAPVFQALAASVRRGEMRPDAQTLKAHARTIEDDSARKDEEQKQVTDKGKSTPGDHAQHRQTASEDEHPSL